MSTIIHHELYPSIFKEFAANPLKDEMIIPCKRVSVIGKSVAIVPQFLDTFSNERDKQVYVPTAHVKQMHEDRIVISRLIAESRGLV